MHNININIYFLIIIIYCTWSALEPFIYGLVLAGILKPIYNKIDDYLNNKFVSSFLSVSLIITIIMIFTYIFKIFVYDDLLIFLMNNNDKLLAQSINEKLIILNNNDNYLGFFDGIVNYFTLSVFGILEGSNSLTIYLLSYVFIIIISSIFFLSNLDNIYDFIYHKKFEKYFNITKFIKQSLDILINYYYTYLRCIWHMGSFFSILIINSSIQKKLLYFYITWIFIFLPTISSTVNLFIFLLFNTIQQNNIFFPQELLIFVFFYIYENYIFIPKCLNKIFNINNFTIWCSIIIFGKLMGFLGMIIGIPLAKILLNIYDER
ncbi:hypothetical protein AB836_01265 [Rickettsiales bacterium (ex Bugula neritina AB1)]|nr:hypothetical protein AB836_01265 [Rickettsiales bacterium (ex Bugula neritina AB1)]